MIIKFSLLKVLPEIRHVSTIDNCRVWFSFPSTAIICVKESTHEFSWTKRTRALATANIVGHALTLKSEQIAAVLAQHDFLPHPNWWF